MKTRKQTRGILLGSILALAVTSALAQAPGLDVARSHLQSNRGALGLTQADIDSLVVADQSVSKPTGITHIYLQQQLEGIPVYGAIVNVAIGSDGRVLHVGNRGVRAAGNKASGKVPVLTAAEAVETAASLVGLKLVGPVRVLSESERGDGPFDKTILAVGEKSIAAQLMYVPTPRSGLRLAWMTTLETPDGQHAWYVGVDAATGAELIRQDLVVQDTFDPSASPFHSDAKPVVNFGLPGATTKSGGSYRVYAVPHESPSHAGDPLVDLRTLESHPADPIASPLGWHDTGLGAFTVTRGNNVHAYTDIDANNVPDPGSDPDGGAGLLFDFPLDFTQQPATYRPAAVTNLFYWNNIIHDVMYQYGFDEASGNFQVNNFGNGGLGNDDVRAEAQDGSGTNNANFFTPSDGNRPRMQMFVWNFNLPNELVVGPPVDQTFPMSGAVFGPPFSPTGVTGTIELVSDTGGVSLTDGCEPLVGFTPGNIALIDRGACTFVLKVQNAEAAGATAVVIANNVPGSPITLGGAAATTIPAGMISLDDGNIVKIGLPATGTARAGANAVSRDSDFDNGVIVHEYGHGISNRLTGGPGTSSCLFNDEQMGEGWSDYYALLLTDTNTETRGIGTYVLFEPTTGQGIRTFPYTRNIAINPSTYDYVKVLAIPHGVGSVWATMLWDMTRDLVDRHGFSSDLYFGNGGNNLSIQLVTEGMKLQPCFPGFVDGRNAILAADVAYTGGSNQCLIWDAFADRGLGFSANQGSSFSVQDGVQAFDNPAYCVAPSFGTLVGLVNDLKTGGFLNGGQANSLLKKLDAAQSAADRGQPVTAANILTSFINEVEDLVANGILTAEQGQNLINHARALREAILYP